MKNKKNWFYGVIATLIWFGVYIILMGNYAPSHDIISATADRGTFMQSASVNVTDDWVGQIYGSNRQYMELMVSNTGML